jgi:hypothetical protein
MRQLSPEIVSLIHHVELNESGWWKKAVGQVIKGVLWKAVQPQNVNEIKAGLKRELGVTLDASTLQKQLDLLVSQSAAVRIQKNDAFKLTENTRQELTLAHERVTAEQETCRKSFLSDCSQFCPDLSSEEVWNFFSKSLSDAVQVAGANLYHLLSDGDLDKEADWLSSFLSRFPTQVEGLRKVLSAFFSPGNHVCRNQVLRLLTAHFFAEATQLRPETISMVEGIRNKRVIKVVLDTNIIFSILQLHDNPADDSAHTLLDISSHNSQKLEVKFYVLPGTLEEAQKTIASQMQLVKNIRVTNAMANAALSHPLPSIARKFFTAARGSVGLTAEAYFQPYIEDLRTILMGKNIHVLDAHPSIYNMRQDVIDDVLEEQEREEREVPEARRKGYETLLHDVVLWHVIKDRRGDDSSTPFDVEYWAVSIDWRLMTFDKKKRSLYDSKLPLVLPPSSLLQLIQFWIPRNAALEEGLIDSLRLSLYFQQFDPVDERATIRVLESISRFENVADFPESTLKLVLANQVLRGRLSEASASNDEVFQLVRDELLIEHNRALDLLGQVNGNLAASEASLQAERASNAESQRMLADSIRELSDAKRRAQETELKAADDESHRIADANRRAEEAEHKAANAEAARLLQETEHQSQLATAAKEFQLKNRFLLVYLALPIVLGIALGVLAYFSAVARPSLFSHTWSIWVITVSVTLFPFSLACLFTQYYIEKHPSLSVWLPSRVAAQIGKKAIAAPILAGGGAIFQGGVWDGVKAIIGW